MAKNLDLRLVKVLRHVSGEPITIEQLASSVARTSKVSADTALTYIWELVNLNYIFVDSMNVISFGSTPVPPELISGGYYTFRSECWSCGKIQEKIMNVFIGVIHWDCLDCLVKWTEVVPDEQSP